MCIFSKGLDRLMKSDMRAVIGHIPREPVWKTSYQRENNSLLTSLFCSCVHKKIVVECNGEPHG